jgi:uncharacterized protein (TIGR02594 family)
LAALLKLGDKGIEVRRLQVLLNAALVPSPGLREDGGFGPRTRDAVVRFQTLKHLTPDGAVGPKTWFALGQRPTALTQAGPPLNAWMDIAKLELGIHENALPGQHNKRIVEYHKTTTLKATTDETPWCSSFVNWVMTKANHKGTDNALAKSWVSWGQDLPAGRQGAITVIKRRGQSKDLATGSSTGYHVAFLDSATPTHVRLLGGNQGDQVKYSNFLLSGYDVIAYRWPS